MLLVFLNTNASHKELFSCQINIQDLLLMMMVLVYKHASLHIKFEPKE